MGGKGRGRGEEMVERETKEEQDEKEEWERMKDGGGRKHI